MLYKSCEIWRRAIIYYHGSQRTLMSYLTKKYGPRYIIFFIQVQDLPYYFNIQCLQKVLLFRIWIKAANNSIIIIVISGGHGLSNNKIFAHSALIIGNRVSTAIFKASDRVISIFVRFLEIGRSGRIEILAVHQHNHDFC